MIKHLLIELLFPQINTLQWFLELLNTKILTELPALPEVFGLILMAFNASDDGGVSP